MKLIIGVVVLAILLIVGTRFLETRGSSRGSGGENAVVSRNGIHWHPTLQIFVRGENVEIPAGIGLVGRHNSMHTHDSDGVIHLEYERTVRNDDIRLRRFFDIWGKNFSETQILEFTNTGTERVRMSVNGIENTEYENYLMQHEDQIEIRFE